MARPGPAWPDGWQGRGRARLTVEAAGSDWRVIEHGRFRPVGARRSVAFANVYRWRRQADGLALAHERFGPERPVDLVVFAPRGAGRLVGVAPHICGADRYHAEIQCVADGLDLVWQVHGPAKQACLHYRYRGARR